MHPQRQLNPFLLIASIIAPIIYVTIYSIDNTCTFLPSADIDKICQIYIYNDALNTILTYGSKLTHNIMPILFMPYLFISIAINVLLISHIRVDFISRHNYLFKVFSGAYLTLGSIFSFISLAATAVIIYMAIIFGAFWIKSSPTHPVNMRAVAMNDTAISIGLVLFAVVPLLAMLPYRRMYKEYNVYINTFHPRDRKNSFRTGVLIAIFLICFEIFLHQFG